MKNSKRLILFLIIPILSIPILILGINTYAPKSTSAYNPLYCTRHCHDRGCLHFAQKVANEEELAMIIHPIYQKTISMLRRNSLGLSYPIMNLLLFVIVLPLLILIVYWNLIKTWKKY